MSRKRSIAQAGYLLVLSLGAMPGGAAAQQEFLWTFDDPDNRLQASRGEAVIGFFDPLGTGWGLEKTTFGQAHEFAGVPPIPGGNAHVARLQATQGTEALSVLWNGVPNGDYAAEGLVSNYTLIFDVLWPASSLGGYVGLYQADLANADDSEIFVRGLPGELGIAGEYAGAIRPDTWHRIAIVVRAAHQGGTIFKYIDGRFVGSHGADGTPITRRWALSPGQFHLFADQDGETADVVLASVLAAERCYSADEIAALGTPSAQGALVPGPPPAPQPPLISRRITILGHRGNSCCAPENTLPSYAQALSEGANHVEMDLHVTADGVAVAFHDDDVSRTTDGSGPIAEKTLAEVQALDAGSWFGQAYAGTRVPKLADVLRLMAGRGRVLLDIKIDNSGAAIARALEEAGAGPKDIWIWTSNREDWALDFQRHIPGAELIWAGVPDPGDEAKFDRLIELGVAGFDMEQSRVTAAAVSAAHEHGLFVSAYVVNGPERLKALTDIGVDAVETDFPGPLDGMMPARVDAVLSGAGFHQRPVAPGKIVSIFGLNLGPGGGGVQPGLGPDGRLQTYVDGVEIWIDGVPAPFFFAGKWQLNVQVPYVLRDEDGSGFAEFIFVRDGWPYEPLQIPVRPASPDLFSYSDGSGRAVALNENGSLNSPADPATRGEIVVLYATGEGWTDPPVIEGLPIPLEGPFPQPILPVRVSVGGTLAHDVPYAGSSPGFVGLMQLNVRVPEDAQPGDAAPVMLHVGGFDSMPATVSIR